MVRVTVVRTGGFAGLRREWTALPGRADASRWVTLIHECPWDAESPDAPAAEGADRFTWRIQARLDDAERIAQLPESRLNGPWRELVAEVQSFESEHDPGSASTAI